MMNVIRRSQIIGLTTMDGSTATEYDRIEEVWLDENGRVVYLAGKEGYRLYSLGASIGVTVHSPLLLNDKSGVSAILQGGSE